MSKIKDWIIWQQEIDSQDGPDMEGDGDGEFADGNEPVDGFNAEGVGSEARRVPLKCGATECDLTSEPESAQSLAPGGEEGDGK
jgi:hypothetical protein